MFLEMARGSGGGGGGVRDGEKGMTNGDGGPSTAVVAAGVGGSGVKVADFSDEDLDALARHQLNGRQIKNAVRTAQALALKEGKVLGMEQVKKVLEVSESFERDLKGGTGYMDAMRSYT